MVDKEQIKKQFANFAKDNWSRLEAEVVFGPVEEKEKFLGDSVIEVTLGGVSNVPWENKPLKQWTWVNKGIHKWGFKSNVLYLAIFKAGANSGDKVRISMKNKRWIVEKVNSE